MEREIKFRQPIFTNGVFEGFHYWGFIERGFYGPITNSDTSIKQAKEQSQQFTGLHDQHGTQIYEGDILGGHPHATVEVRWNQRAAAFETVCFEIDYNDEGELFTRQDSNLLSNDLTDCGDAWSVIGHTFEHPHLHAAGVTEIKC